MSPGVIFSEANGRMESWVRRARRSAASEEICLDDLSIDGAQKQRSGAVRSRVLVAILCFIGVYSIIGARLIDLAGVEESMASTRISTPQEEIAAIRPDILDVNGNILATDVRAVAVYAEPRRMVDVDEAIERLTTVLPDLDRDRLRIRLDSQSGFEWIMREVTPPQRDAIHALGIPGIGFLQESRRFYPGARTVSHVLGHVDVDNRGIAGLEKYIDGLGLRDLQAFGFARSESEQMEPVRLSIDLRVQHVVRSELEQALQVYQAIAGVGIVLDAKTGEVVAMASLPDYDPNAPSEALQPDRLNRATGGVFEMGSIFKTFTTAAALDSGKVTLEDSFDARQPIRVGARTINDFHAQRRVLTVPEVFIYSSNVGTAHMAMRLGVEGEQDYFRRFGLMDKVEGELPESATPLLPARWTELALMTTSFGHGMSVTPLQVAAAAAGLVNDGMYLPPTFFPRSQAEVQAMARRIVSSRTSEAMRYLMRLNVERGSGRSAEVPGLEVGGKTGTAEKVINGQYDDERKLNSFLAVFPSREPRYVVLVTIDEPKPAEGQPSATAGMNAAPTAGAIIRRIGPILGVMPASAGLDQGIIEAAY